MNPRIGWGQPPTGWAQPQLPGWAPLVDPGPRSLHAARSVAPLVVADPGRQRLPGRDRFQVLGHDDPTPGLSGRGLLTVALAAAVVVLLTLHRRYGPGPLARALAEYAVVVVLAVLVATTGVPLDQPAAAATRPAPGPGQPRSATSGPPILVRTIGLPGRLRMAEP